MLFDQGAQLLPVKRFEYQGIGADIDAALVVSPSSRLRPSVPATVTLIFRTATTVIFIT